VSSSMTWERRNGNRKDGLETNLYVPVTQNAACAVPVTWDARDCTGVWHLPP